MTVQLAHRLVMVDEYYRMAEAGILHEDDRVELLQGEIVETPPIGSSHTSVVDRLTRALTSLISQERATIRVQNPVRLGQLSEPVPDISLLRPKEDFYAAGHPVPSDVLLPVEVADSSLPSDRSVKLPIYAEAEIQEVWIIDVNGGALELYSGPSRGGYTASRMAHRGEAVCRKPLLTLR